MKLSGITINATHKWESGKRGRKREWNDADYVLSDGELFVLTDSLASLVNVTPDAIIAHYSGVDSLSTDAAKKCDDRIKRERGRIRDANKLDGISGIDASVIEYEGDEGETLYAFVLSIVGAESTVEVEDDPEVEDDTNDESESQ